MAYSYSTLWPLLKLQPLLLLCHPIFCYFCSFFLIFFSLSLVLSAFWCFLLSSYFSSLSGLLINVYHQIVNIFLSFDFVLLDSNERSLMLPAASTFAIFLFFKNHGKCGIVRIEVLLDYLLSLLTFLLGLIKIDYESNELRYGLT